MSYIIKLIIVTNHKNMTKLEKHKKKNSKQIKNKKKYYATWWPKPEIKYIFRINQTRENQGRINKSCD